MKLDSKAYDRVEWGFLRKILLRFGMHSRFFDLIMLCVTSVSYYFLLNGSKFEALKPRRSIRQGDPLSLYLYICVLEASIGLVNHVEQKG